MDHAHLGIARRAMSGSGSGTVVLRLVKVASLSSSRPGTVGVKTGAKSRDSGFTLMELIVTMALAAVVMTLGVPAFRDFIQEQQIITQTNRLIGALNLARSEATKRGVRVVICRTAGADCAADVTGIWEGGWLIYADNNGSGVRDAEEPILRVGHHADGEITIRTGGAFTRWLAYQPSGFSVGNTNLGNGTFRICDGRGADHARFVAINVTGRARVREKRAGDTCP